MKYLILSFLIISSFHGTAQIVRGFGGVSGYLDGDFEKSTALGLNAGTEFNVNRFLKPEIELSYYYGAREDITYYTRTVELSGHYKSFATALNFSFCPKIGIGNKGRGDTYLVLLPKYSFSKVSAFGEFNYLNEDKVNARINDKITQWQHSIGIGIGIDIGVTVENDNSLSLIIFYQNFPMSKPLKELNQGPRIIDESVFGAGMNYYFTFKKSKKPSPIKTPNPLP